MDQAMQDTFETLLNFFKVLGNESRLKIVGLLANQEYTVGELAAKLDLKEPTISQHLATLKAAGLVDVRPDGNFRYYSFNSKALTTVSKDVFSREQLASMVSKFDEVGDDWERKTLQTFVTADRLTQIPASEKKLLVIIKWLAGKFEPGVQYPEKQVNQIILDHCVDEASVPPTIVDKRVRYVADYMTLRRELVDFHYLQREKGSYWRTDKPL